MKAENNPRSEIPTNRDPHETVLITSQDWAKVSHCVEVVFGGSMRDTGVGSDRNQKIGATLDEAYEKYLFTVKKADENNLEERPTFLAWLAYQEKRLWESLMDSIGPNAFAYEHYYGQRSIIHPKPWDYSRDEALEYLKEIAPGLIQ